MQQVISVEHVEFLVEEQSAEAALKNLLPKLLPKGITFDIHPHNGKRDLLSKLPGKLRGYRQWLPDNFRIVVLIDKDRDECQKLKRELEDIATGAKFVTKSTCCGQGSFQIVNRLAIEELEAWFLGDIEAINKAYPKVPNKLPCQDPDNIKGGTWEKLERILKKAGYYPTGLPKIEAAHLISQHMTPERNRSKSFQTFVKGLNDLIRQ